MSRRRPPFVEVLLAAALIVGGIAAYVFYSGQSRKSDESAAIAIAKSFPARGTLLEKLVVAENLGSTVTWSVVAVSDVGLVRVSAEAVRQSGVSDYRFDVDPEQHTVHAANPLARELLEPPANDAKTVE